MFAAMVRGQHRYEEAPPWVLDDPFGLVLVGAGWRQLHEMLAALLPAELRREIAAGVALRSRYAEDRLVDGGFTQYVLLGAGLDSFAWRRPDLLASVRVLWCSGTWPTGPTGSCPGSRSRTSLPACPERA
jgi:O-methyltransferase involved in polyketide biosynthesis